MSSYSEGQTHQLMNALEANGFTPGHVAKLGQYKQLGDIRLVLDGQAEIVVVKKEEVPLDTIIRVDRSVRPAYPDWVEKAIHPELECTGPAEYDLATAVSLWFHDLQKGGVTTGQVIYDYLKKHGLLASCGSLPDALEIQKKGVEVFRKIFGNNYAYFWKSVVRHRGDGSLCVPFLYVDGDRVVLYWSWLGYVWHGHELAVRFAS